MTATSSRGEPKVVAECTYPLTAAAAVDVVVTELSVFRLRDGELHLTELLGGATRRRRRRRHDRTLRRQPGGEPCPLSCTAFAEVVDVERRGRRSAVRLPRLRRDAPAGAEGAARRHSGDAVGADGPGLRRVGDRPARQRPHAPARRRSARRADHRHGPGARPGRQADARAARRDLAGERRRPLSARDRHARRAARPELHRAAAAASRTTTAGTGS